MGTFYIKTTENATRLAMVTPTKTFIFDLIGGLLDAGSFDNTKDNQYLIDEDFQICAGDDYTNYISKLKDMANAATPV